MMNPFAELEQAAGAALVEVGGLPLPARYGDPEAEYRAAREAAGIVDLGFRGLLRVAGSERLRWLNGQITQDVKALRADEGKPAAVLSAKGHLLADLSVAGSADAVWIDLPRARAAAVREAFERHIIADDVQVEEQSHRFARLLVVGPRAADVVSAALRAEVGSLAPWHQAEVRLDDAPIRLVAAGWLRSPGFDLVTPAERAAGLWSVLARAGRDLGARPVGMDALEALRLEAGWPWFGVDFDERHLLMEALTADHVSFTKGCYIGQEVVIRVEHQGRLNKRLCGLMIHSDAVPPPAAPLTRDGRAVGHVTSAAHSPALGRPIALGYVHRDSWSPGTRLALAGPDGPREAEVVPLPFVPPPATPRGSRDA